MSAVPYCDDYTCPYINREKCDDVDTLDVIQQFRKLYENKLREIDQQGCTDSVKLKLKVQQKWIEDLTEQTEMMARVVKELELEAAERVQLLEEKLKKSAECACEVMRRYQMYDFQFNSDDYFQRIACLENDIKNLLEFIRRIREDGKWSIDGLAFYDVDYQDLFGKDQQGCKCNSDVAPIDEGVCRGEEEVSSDNQHKVIERLRKEIENLRSTGDPEQLLESLRKQNADHNELKQSMVDMRQALTEEVACKHDLILSLKKDIQQLEERCIQSDKQTAFKDDIIKELRKEIKQLKQQQPSLESIEKTECDCEEAIKELEENHRLEVFQLQQKINSLKKQLADNAKPHSTPRSGCQCGQTEKPETDNTKLIRNKDEIIQLQNGTLNMIQIDLQEKKKKEKVLGDEIEKRQIEIEQLKEKCKQLEKSLANSKEQSENLQKAVDLYLNSINVLEASEERCKLEIEQQRTTIINLQEALVNVKQEVDEIKGRNQQDFNNQQQMVNLLYSKLIDMETNRDNLCTELSAITEAYKKAVDLNFDLEVEHFNSLQDMTVLETHLIKYQNQLRDEERQLQCLNNDLKKAQLEKQDCEHLVSCLKKDISIMSKQLRNLHEILEISNKKCEEETQDLLDTLANLQNKNQGLQTQLDDNEEKFLRESLEKTTIINELRSTIEQKTADFDVLSRTIDDLKERLTTKNQTNNNLQMTIAGLNRKIIELQSNQLNEDVYKELTDRIQRLEARNQQKVNELLEEKDRLRKILDDAINELQTIRNTKAISVAELELIQEQQRQQCERMKRQLQSVEDEKKKIEEELAETRRQCKRALEKLKESLTTINAGLIDGKSVKNPDDHYKNRSCECNLFESCMVEIAFTDRLLKGFKDEYKKLLNNSAVDGHSKGLIEQLHVKDQQILQYQRELQKFTQQNTICLCEYVKSLMTKLGQEVNDGTTRTNQDEIVMLKDQIKNIFQDQENLKKENDTLLTQINNLQVAISKHEDANRLFHVQYEANHAEIQQLLESNRLLEQQKDDINNELERVQNHCRCVEKKNRQLNEIIKNLEVELLQMKAKRGDICAEIKVVVDCVRAWLSEQKKINEVQQRKPCWCTSKKHDSSSSSSIPNVRNKSTNRSTFDYDWGHNLGSQGTDSTGCPSPESCSPDDLFTQDVEDDESTDTEPDDEIVRRVEEFINQIRCRNRCVRGKFPKFFPPKHDN